VAVKPWVVQAEVTVRGVNVIAGTVVSLDIGGELATEYGGIGNLAPLPADQSGDDADHSGLSN
jgi:hypothetical protein